MAKFSPSSSYSILISSLDTRRIELHKIRKMFRFSKPVNISECTNEKETFAYLLICFCIMMNIERKDYMYNILSLRQGISSNLNRRNFCDSTFIEVYKIFKFYN